MIYFIHVLALDIHYLLPSCITPVCIAVLVNSPLHRTMALRI
jgi:hypothetical protein